MEAFTENKASSGAESFMMVAYSKYSRATSLWGLACELNATAVGLSILIQREEGAFDQICHWSPSYERRAIERRHAQ